jgi:hypothetical protein
VTKRSRSNDEEDTPEQTQHAGHATPKAAGQWLSTPSPARTTL